MININVSSQLKTAIIDAGLELMNKRAEKMLAEIHYFDGYSEYPCKYYDKDNNEIKESGDEYNDQRMVCFKHFTNTLTKLTETRKGVPKGSNEYWNHCLVVIDLKGDNSIIFSYSQELEQCHDKKLLSALGEDLYREYKEETEKGSSSNKTTANIAPRISNHNMDVNQLLTIMYQELIKDLPSQWSSFQVEAEFFQHNGKNVVNNYYRYSTSENSNYVEFTPLNVILLGNATTKIQKLMEEKNEPWRKAMFSFKPENNVDVSILDR